MKTAVRDLEFQKAFCNHTRSAHDKRGLGSPGDTGVRVNKKSIVGRVKELQDEESISKIHSLAIQGKWTSWDELIEVDLKWNEIMYGYSPSLLSFWLNAVQDTLPDPVNLQRWAKTNIAECGLCKWKNCSLQHIICSCKVALRQGRISFRHDSILGCIEKAIKEKLLEEKKKKTGLQQIQCQGAEQKIQFVKAGTKVKKKKREKKYTFWSECDDDHDGGDDDNNDDDNAAENNGGCPSGFKKCPDGACVHEHWNCTD